MRQHPTVEERRERGAAARREVPRSRLAEWDPPADRFDPVQLLESQAVSRIQDLVPIRYGRMLASPFAFYRGAAAIMAADLAASPTSGITVQACGDAHLSNFGLYASPARTLVFDLNDFDETLPAPWEWDVKRLTASLEIAGRNNGFGRKDRRRIVRAAAAGYRTTMRDFAEKPNLEVWYSRSTVQKHMPVMKQMLTPKDFAQAEKVVTKAMAQDSSRAASRLTRVVDGQRRIVHDPPLIEPMEMLGSADEAARVSGAMHEMINDYRQTLSLESRYVLESFRYVHLARKVVGVGSVGTRAWIILMTGRDDEDVLLLQAKEAQASVLAPYAEASQFDNQGQRVVEGQRLMQASGDIFLGWHRAEGIDGQLRDYYIRQLRDWKGSWDPAAMSPHAMVVYGSLCGAVLARAHARSGDRIAIASYLGSSDRADRALVDFAEAYADQNERDCAALRRAVEDGRCAATTGV